MVEPLLPGGGAVSQPGPGRPDDLPGIPGRLPGGLGDARGPGDGADPPRGARAGRAAGGRRAVAAVVVPQAGRGAAPARSVAGFQPGGLARVASRATVADDEARVGSIRGAGTPLGLPGVPAFERPRPMRDEVVGLMNGFQVAVGLLLLSVGAATSLAEERVRGSLDVLLSTPMSTRSILAGKWWGSFRRVCQRRHLAGRDVPAPRLRPRTLGGLRAAARPGAGLRRPDHQPGPGGGDVGEPARAARSRSA